MLSDNNRVRQRWILEGSKTRKQPFFAFPLFWIASPPCRPSIAMPKKENKGVNKNTVLAREYTINLHKRTHGLCVPLS
jgi:hypothetical protein